MDKTLNTKHSTLNTKHSTLNTQHSTLNTQHFSDLRAARAGTAIAKYVKSHYKGQVITKIDKERHGFDVKLSNGMELKFSRSGAFLGIDD